MNEHYGKHLSFANRLVDIQELMYLSLKLQLGSRFWLYPLLPLLWPIFLTGMRVFNFEDDFSAASAQSSIVGAPMYFLAIALGMQIVSSEIEQRTLEVCYTVPGGAKRIWIAKMLSASLLLLTSTLILSLYTYIVLTPFPIAALYRVMQGAVVFLILSMAFGALFKNKMTAGMAAIIVLVFTALLTDFGSNPTRYSPFFNPISLEGGGMSNTEILYWLIQNHIGFALVGLTLTVLTFSRAERRELLLSDD